MEEQRPGGIPAFLLRFDAFFLDDLSPMLASMGFGVLLAWAWLGLGDGFPVFVGLEPDDASVAVLFLSFAATAFCTFLWKGGAHILQRRATPYAAAGLAAAGCAVLAAVRLTTNGIFSGAALALVRLCMVPVGAGAAMLFVLFGVCLSLQKTRSGIMAFAFAAAATFVSYHCVTSIGTLHSKIILSCLLPLVASGLMMRSQPAICRRIDMQPAEEGVLASGFVQLLIAFTVYSFAFGCMRGLENAGDFAVGANGGVTGLLVVAVVLAYLVAVRKIGVFKLLKRLYSAGIVVLVACVVLSRLSPRGIDPWYSIVCYTDFFALVIVLWLLLCFVAHANETPVLKVFGFALALCAMGIVAGWAVGSVTHLLLGTDRVYVSIAMGCMVAVFCTFGFSPKSFPRLTVGGEGAKKLVKTETTESVVRAQVSLVNSSFGVAFAETRGLSLRELEVVELLLSGHSADFISHKLCISYNTVRTHIRNIYAKLEVHSRDGLAELVASDEAAYLKRKGKGCCEEM